MISPSEASSSAACAKAICGSARVPAATVANNTVRIPVLSDVFIASLPRKMVTILRVLSATVRFLCLIRLRQSVRIATIKIAGQAGSALVNATVAMACSSSRQSRAGGWIPPFRTLPKVLPAKMLCGAHKPPLLRVILAKAGIHRLRPKRRRWKSVVFALEALKCMDSGLRRNDSAEGIFPR